MAIEEVLNRFMKVFYPLCDDRSDGCDHECHKCAKLDNTIIKSLEKQIPQKPIKVFDEQVSVDWCKCPSCQEGLGWFANITKRILFCKRCGQAIDWD